jgi:hypothetical protein
MKFKIGDRVYVHVDGQTGGSYGPDCSMLGKHGTVVCFSPGSGYPGVRFDHRVNSGHNLHGNCDSGFGYYLHPNHLNLKRCWREI